MLPFNRQERREWRAAACSVLLALPLLVLPLSACAPATPGVSKHENTVYLRGPIDAAVARAAVRLFTPEVTTLVVDSEGGDELAAIAIGSAVALRKLHVVVEDKCHSACAQYIFVAGGQKVVSPGSVVSCHHNAIGVADDPPGLLSGGALDRVGRVRIAAGELYSKVGASLDFARACMSAVVPLCYCTVAGEDYLKSGYSVWIPTAHAFQQFGINDVVGAPASPEAADALASLKGLDASSTLDGLSPAMLQGIPLCSEIKVGCE